jgi:hypothetical protein
VKPESIFKIGKDYSPKMPIRKKNADSKQQFLTANNSSTKISQAEDKKLAIKIWRNEYKKELKKIKIPETEKIRQEQLDSFLKCN